MGFEFGLSREELDRQRRENPIAGHPDFAKVVQAHGENALFQVTTPEQLAQFLHDHGLLEATRNGRRHLVLQVFSARFGNSEIVRAVELAQAAKAEQTAQAARDADMQAREARRFQEWNRIQSYRYLVDIDSAEVQRLLGYTGDESDPSEEYAGNDELRAYLAMCKALRKRVSTFCNLINAQFGTPEYAALVAEFEATWKQQWALLQAERVKLVGRPNDLRAEFDALKRRRATPRAKGVSFSAGEIASYNYLEHSVKLKETGLGVYSTAYAPEGKKPIAGTKPADCMVFVMDALGSAFAENGQAALWQQVLKTARAISERRGTGLTGIDLMSALEQLAGWRHAFLISDDDPRSSRNKAKQSRHLPDLQAAESDRPMYAAPEKKVPGIAMSHIFRNYAPAQDSQRAPDAIALEQIKRLPFALVSLRGSGAADTNGSVGHMAVMTHGKVIEFHVGAQNTSPLLVERSDIARWAYKSSVISVPGGDLASALAQQP